MVNAPLITLEEPYEAFALWSRLRPAFSRGPGVLRFCRSNGKATLPLWPAELAELQDVRNREGVETLSIARRLLGRDSYLVPALAAGLIGDVCWVQKKKEVDARSVYLKASFSPETSPEQITVQYLDDRAGGVEFGSCSIDTIPETSEPLLIEIDCSFFSANLPAKVPETQLALTEEGYQEFRSNPYHNLNLLYDQTVSAESVDGTYALRLNPLSSLAPGRLRLEGHGLSKAIDSCVATIKSKVANIAAVSISLSEKSGHTPSDQAREIQQALLAGLNSEGTFSVFSIEEFLSQ